MMKPGNPLIVVNAMRRARREIEEAYAAGRFQDAWTQEGIVDEYEFDAEMRRLTKQASRP